jgi:hypothetical protein
LRPVIFPRPPSPVQASETGKKRNGIGCVLFSFCFLFAWQSVLDKKLLTWLFVMNKLTKRKRLGAIWSRPEARLPFHDDKEKAGGDARALPPAFFSSDEEPFFVGEGIMSNDITTQWVGPFRLREYLEKAIDPDQVWPPRHYGVYVVSLRTWKGVPTTQAGILYAGGNSSKTARFRRRVANLIPAMLGIGGPHSGGRSLWGYCREKRIHPWTSIWDGQRVFLVTDAPKGRYI